LDRKKKSRFAMSRQRRGAMVVMCALVAGAVVWLDRGRGKEVRREIVRRWPRNDTEKYDGRRFKVVNIVDGDTLDIDVADGEYEHTRVRLLGLDTPETAGGRGEEMYYAREATEFVEGLALGEEVTVILDEKSPARDRYGRLLAHLELADGRSVNEELVGEGFAYADLRFANDRFERYVRLGDEARADKKGLWKEVTKEQLPKWLQRERPGI
jgi:endonuclease YncB( thermonuclease family)